MKKNSENLYEIALKISGDSTLLEHSFSNKSIYGMLLEDINDADVEKLRTAVKTSLEATENNIKISTSAGLPALADYFTKIKNALKKGDELASKLDLADPEGVMGKLKGFFGKKVDLGRSMQAVINLQNQANTAANTLGNAMELLIRNLEGKVEDDVKLTDLNKDDHGLDADQMKSGISKAFKSSKPSGFMAKLGSLLGKSKIAAIPGAEEVGDFPVDAVAGELMGLTFGELKNIGNDTAESADKAEDAAVPTDAIKNIQDDAAEDSTKEQDQESTEAQEADEASEDTGEAPENPEEESDPEAEIKAAASESQSTPMSPKDAISKALADWEESLSDSSQKTIRAKNRNQELKDAIFTGIDKGKEAVQNAVSDAVKDWRANHEETLIKSKRFAKKNFDSLQQLIPSLAAQVLAQTKESRRRKINTSEIKRFVNKKLNEKFYPNNRLFETWQKNAGLLKD